MDPSGASSMSESTVARSMRAVLGLFAAALVLVLYTKTANPTNDIKWLLLVWGAFLFGIWWIASVWWFGGEARRPAILLEVQLLMLFFFAAATAASDFIAVSMAETARFAALFMLYLIAAQIFSRPEQLRRWMEVACIGVALASLYGLCQFAGIDPIAWGDTTSDVYTNLPATFGNPNFAAHVLILTLIMALYLWRGAPRGLWLVVILICGTHFLMTHQRAGMVALAAAAILCGVAWLLRKQQRPVLATLASVVVLGLLGCATAAAVMYGLYLYTGTPFPLDASLLLRYQSYIGATDMILEAPLLGHGPGVYPLINPLYWTVYEQHWFAQELRMNAHVHNDSLELAIDAGLPAAGLYLVMLVLGICHSLTMAFTAAENNRRNLGYALAAIFCAFLIDGLFGFNLRVPVSAAFLFILLGALDGILSSDRAPKGNALLPAPLWRIALAGALLFTVITESRVYASKYMLRSAIQLAAEGQNSAADAAFATSRALAPWRGDAAVAQGRLALNAGRFDAAQEYLEAALELRPNAPDARLAAAQAAVAAAQAALGDPDRSAALLDQCMAHVTQALETCPMYPQGHEILGKAYMMKSLTATGAAQSDAWENAEAHLVLAVEYGAGNPAELYGLVSKIRMARGEWLAAEEMLARAVQVDPASPDAWGAFVAFAHERRRYERIQSTLYHQLGRFENEKANPGLLAASYLRLAEVLENGDGTPEAIEDAYRGAARHAPDRPEVWAKFGRYAVSQRRLEGLRDALAAGIETLRETGKELPGQLKYIEAIDAVFRRQGAVLEDAVATLAASVRAHSPSAPVTAAQQYGWAAQILLNTANNLDDTPCGVWLSLGFICSQIENLPAADNLFKQADACLPEDQRPYLVIHWAACLAGLGRETEAVEKLEAARLTHPDSLDIQWQYARQLFGVGRIADARAVYTATLERDDLGTEIRQRLEAELEALPTLN